MNEFMNILFDWCSQEGTIKIFEIISYILKLVRFIVPIGLVVMTTIDIFKKVINPDDKDGQKKILTRIIVGLIVFFVPLVVRFIVTLAEKGGADYNETSLSCLQRLF